jgi:hypothetical protein
MINYNVLWWWIYYKLLIIDDEYWCRLMMINYDVEVYGNKPQCENDVERCRIVS